MTNRDKAQAITNKHYNEWIAEFIENNNLSKEDRNQLRFKLYNACNEMAEWKDEQTVKRLGGWSINEPDFDCFCIVKTAGFPKNCEYVVAEWDNDAKMFYSESNDEPIVDWEKWKLIERK